MLPENCRQSSFFMGGYMHRLGVQVVVGFIFCVLSLAGCGSGNESESRQTPAGTVVDLTALKEVYLGETAGAQLSFAFSAYSSAGTKPMYTGTHNLISDGTTIVEGQSFTERRTVQMVQTDTGGFTFTPMVLYFLPTGEISRFIGASGAIPFTATSAVAIPSNARVGDSGNIGVLITNDGASTIVMAWKLDAGQDGSSILSISTDLSGGYNELLTEHYYLDSRGVPTQFAITMTGGGSTTSWFGPRI